MVSHPIMENTEDKMTEVKHLENAAIHEESYSDHDQTPFNEWLGIQTDEDKRPFTCNDCGKSFRKNSDFRAHCLIHTGEKPFPCNDCGKSFRRNTDLKAHRRIHDGETAYVCSDCGQCFIKKSLLEKHQKVHTGEKPFSCSICGKSFSQRPNLLEHQRVHTGEKPFGCLTCGKYFSYRSTLTRHQKIHTGEKPHVCSECGKGFINKGKLTEHFERVHSDDKPFSCNICGKCFSRQRYVTYHQGVHSDDKQFSCSVCGKTFNQKSRFLHHQKSHSVEKVCFGENAHSSDEGNVELKSSNNCPLESEAHISHCGCCGEKLEDSSNHICDMTSREKESNEKNLTYLKASKEKSPQALSVTKESDSNETNFKICNNEIYDKSESKDFHVSSIVKIEVDDGLVDLSV